MVTQKHTKLFWHVVMHSASRRYGLTKQDRQHRKPNGRILLLQRNVVQLKATKPAAAKRSVVNKLQLAHNYLSIVSAVVKASQQSSQSCCMHIHPSCVCCISPTTSCVRVQIINCYPVIPVDISSSCRFIGLRHVLRFLFVKTFVHSSFKFCRPGTRIIKLILDKFYSIRFTRSSLLIV